MKMEDNPFNKFKTTQINKTPIILLANTNLNLAVNYNKKINH